jgi:23S rRNA pseudouridine2605 synthase
VLVARRPDEEQLESWRRGIVLEDGYRTAPAEVRIEAPFGMGTWLRVVLKEGRKRQIRETGTLLGLPVVKIIRVRIGSLYLGGLKLRQWRHLTHEEIDGLKEKNKSAPAGKTTAKAPQKSAPKTGSRTSSEAVRGRSPKGVPKSRPHTTSKAPTKPSRKSPLKPPQKSRYKKPRSRS